MRIRSLLLAVPVLGLAFAFGAPADAATTYKGKVSVGNNPAGLTPAEVGTGGVTVQAFLAACKADLASMKAGQKGTAVDQFLASPLNGHDGFVFDLKKETNGTFAVKGPGAKAIGPEVSGIQFTDYDFDIDFYLHPTADPGSTKSTGCLNGNEKATSSAHKCYAHSAKPDEKTGCASGFKDSKGKTRFPRYAVANAATNIRGPFDFTLTVS